MSSNRDRFVELVKLYVAVGGTAGPPGPDPAFTAVAVVARAMALPDWAPRIEDVRDAGNWASIVKGFVLWNYRVPGHDAPDWFSRAAGHAAAEVTEPVGV